MSKQSDKLKAKVRASKNGTLKKADPKAPTRVMLGGRPTKPNRGGGQTD